MESPQLVVPVGDRDHTSGPDNAPVTLVEYGDFECPHCGRAEPILQKVRRSLVDQLRFVYRHFPLAEAHPHARSAAEAAEAAGAEGKFWEMHDILYRNQRALSLPDLLEYAREIGADSERVARELDAGLYRKKVSDDFRNGIRSGVNGTPTFFINGVRYDGDWSDTADFIHVLSEAASHVAAS